MPDPYIDFQHVSKAFGDNHVLDDVSFEVFPGETVCILGRSGVGKSVSLHHIMAPKKFWTCSRFWMVRISRNERDGA